MTTSKTQAQPSGAEARVPRTVAAFELPREVRPGEELVLAPTGGGAARLRIEPAEERRALRSLPLTIDLLPGAQASAFGIEERCRVVAAGGAVAIECEAGQAPAGALIRLPARYPAGARAQGRMAASGGGGFAAQLVTVGREATRAVPVARETALPLPTESTAAAQLVVLAPAAGGSLRINQLSIEPLSPPRVATAGGWAWEPALWRRGGDQLIEAAAKRGLGRLYVTLSIEHGRVAHRSELIRFLRTARGRGIAVEAVEGDPDMVTPAGLRSALERARAIARFERTAPADARLAGVQYDIEPYTLATWGVPPADYRGWADAVRALAEAVGRPVHLVLPFWIADDEGGLRLLRDVAPSLSGVTAMAYRSDAAAIGPIAEPLLSWGVAADKPVRIAMEAGPVAPESQERFRQAAAGTLAVWRGDGPPRAALLEKEGRVAGAQMFASLGRAAVEPARISFLGDEARMLRTAGELSAAFGAWSSFQGMSYHGLSWPEPRASTAASARAGGPPGS